jgi:hypothetical protein
MPHSHYFIQCCTSSSKQIPDKNEKKKDMLTLLGERPYRLRRRRDISPNTVWSGGTQLSRERLGTEANWIKN